MTTQQIRILLLGAGELGLAVHTSISSLPNTHIALAVHSPQNYTHLSSPNTTLLSIDLTSPSPSLIETFSAYPIIISCTGFATSPGSVMKLAHEILSAGQLRQRREMGKLWYFPWQWGVDYDVTGDRNGVMPLFGEQKAVRELLRKEAEQSGVCWTVLSTGIFMSFLFEPFWGVVDRIAEHEKVLTVRCLGEWGHGFTVTDVGDIGRVIRRILTGDVEAENRVLYAAGDSVRYGELADIVGRVTGCDVVKEAWSVEHLQEELKKDPDDGIKKYRLVFSGDGVFWQKEKTVNHQLGIDRKSVV